MLQSMGSQRVRQDRASEQEQPTKVLSNLGGEYNSKVEFWFDILGTFRKGMVNRANREELKSD